MVIVIVVVVVFKCLVIAVVLLINANPASCRLVKIISDDASQDSNVEEGGEFVELIIVDEAIELGTV